MKKSYKIMALLLVAIMCVGCFTGCGKTEEEKAMEEMAEKFEEGLKQDEALKEDLDNVKEQLKSQSEITREMTAEDFPVLKKAFNDYKEAVENRKALAEEYNRLFDEVVAKRTAQGLDEQRIVSALASNILYNGKIPAWTIDGFETYKENYSDMNYKKVVFSWNRETNDFVYYFFDEDSVGTIVKKDGSTCNVNLLDMGNISSADLDSFNDEEMVFFIKIDGETKYCKIDISQKDATLVELFEDRQRVEDYEKMECYNDMDTFVISINFLK